MHLKEKMIEKLKGLDEEVVEEYLEVISRTRALGWNVSLDDGDYINLQRYSPAGQDFYITVEIGEDADDFINNIYECYENFDVSYETYLWLDSEGHGINGAPYDMRDLYNDMETCEQYILKLHEYLTK